jgi:ABC-type uncharacterized transport system involved in gliding motility auxiliary subunit
MGVTGQKRGAWVNVILMTLFFAALLAGINIWSDRHSTRLDLTRDATYSIDGFTRRVVKDVDQPVRVTIVYDPAGLVQLGQRMDLVVLAYQRLEDMLEEMQALNANIEFRILNPHRQARAAMELHERKGIRAGDILFQSTLGEARASIIDMYTPGEEKGLMAFTGENTVVNALIRLQTGERRRVYFMTGHGEPGLDTSNPDQVGKFAAYLKEKEAVDAEELILEKVPRVPGDCELLVINGPRARVPSETIDKIQDYLADGGKALILLDPVLNPSADPGLGNLLSLWNVAIGSNMIFDTVNAIRDATYPMTQPAATWGDHPITEPFRGDATWEVMFRSVSTVDAVGASDIAVTPLVWSHPTAWGEVNPTEGVVPEYTAGEDLKGEQGLPMAASVEKVIQREESQEAVTTRLVVVGDAALIRNHWEGIHPNLLFAHAAVQWLLTEGEEDILVPAAQTTINPVNLTDRQLNQVFFLTVLILPLIGLGMAGMAWYFRRR